MYRYVVKDKPRRCEDCPLKNSITRDCGTVEPLKPSSSGMLYIKTPDGKCKFKYHSTAPFKKTYAE